MCCRCTGLPLGGGGGGTAAPYPTREAGQALRHLAGTREMPPVALAGRAPVVLGG